MSLAISFVSLLCVFVRPPQWKLLLIFSSKKIRKKAEKDCLNQCMGKNEGNV